ncbi:GGDEF domain-containing protein [Cellvibrio sp. UBA7661]|uniref:GGDEF domain-containing protein n=1 Tax=Cellvibrio sp. UBA7661 TaxID=1946311 RepID=UPI002F360E6F
MTIQHDILKARLLGLLIIITLCALAFQHYGPERTLIVGQDSGLYFEAIDDRGNGGKSVATLSRDGEKFILDCDIIASEYAWPYCEISFNLADQKGKGKDLTNYERVTLYAKYSEPQTFGVRFQLINYNPAYARKGEDNSLKYNAIELFDTHERYPQVIDMSHMQVPTWWLSQGKIPPEFWGPEFNEVRGVQIATGEQVKPGKYQMIIERIEISGKYISDRTLYLLLLAIWTLAAMSFFISTLHKANIEVMLNKQRQHQLEALNRLLNQEHKELEERLTRDPLTGVFNRDGLAPIFQLGFDSDVTPLLSLIFIDIDHFKKVNDTYGHPIGDQVLLAFAQTLSANTRTHDLLARWGGEEFVLACPDTSLENALGLAEKLRRAIEESEWPKQLKLTASFGVAQMMEGESPTDFIARADKALYVAKAQGRNCVRASNQGPATLVAVK